MRKEEGGCRLVINTDGEHPNVITEITGLIPEKIIVKDAPFVNMSGKVVEGVFNKDNIWIYSINKTELEEGVYINILLKRLFDTLDQHGNSFQLVFSKFSKKHISCYGYTHDYHHYFILDKSLLNQINNYAIDIEFDTYFFDDEK